MSFLFRAYHISIDHKPHQIFEGCLRLPTELSFGLGCVTNEQIHFRRAVVALIDF
jgi:hypothetical protein